ncbi:hypothetical protein IFM89_006353 [Coptis chinensis]|uniref:Uncharacterized protein n=1 Tax=Coptis chinensis TaxID=261450 RepID=A0A835LYQ2_9MAGN|nr:hypothetical protein IFM89_006353 [Coptis chinensis]
MSPSQQLYLVLGRLWLYERKLAREKSLSLPVRGHTPVCPQKRKSQCILLSRRIGVGVYRGKARRQSRVLDEVSHVPPSTRYLLKNFRKRTVALGSVSNDVPSTDSYNITIDDIFDYTTELYVGEGTFGDISIGDTITWPMPFEEPI